MIKRNSRNNDYQWIDDDPELKSEIEEFKSRWVYEFDTKENQHIINSQLKELIQSYISKKRDDKINSILE